MKKQTRLFLAAFLGLFTIAVVFAIFIGRTYIKSPASGEAHSVIFEVTPAKSFTTVAAELQKAGVITNARFFYLYARFMQQRSHLRVGEYELRTDMLPSEVLTIITSGKSRTKPFVVPEGYNIFEIADLYEKEGFGTHTQFMNDATNRSFVHSLLGQNYDSFEGYLFPETYLITKFMNARDVITAMVRRFQVVYAEVGADSPLKNWSPHQIVTLASIIEKETGAPQERKIISSVFHNRIVKQMRLQTDPTVIYGMALGLGKVPFNIHKEDLLRPTRYNTYVIPGLPPGPISNPGRDALVAAMNPDRTEYLYFVSQNNGTHVFTRSYQDHLEAVRKYQMDPRARAGKSWRDLKKTTETH